MKDDVKEVPLTPEVLAFMDLKGKIVKLMYEFTDKYAAPDSELWKLLKKKEG